MTRLRISFWLHVAWVCVLLDWPAGAEAALLRAEGALR